VKKILLAAGILTAALFGYKTYNDGSLSLPPVLSSLLSPTKSGPMKKDFPSHAIISVDSAQAGTPPGVDPAQNPQTADITPAGTFVGEANLGTGTPAFADEDVNTRITRAMEMSKNLMANDVAPTAKSDAEAGAPKNSAKALYAGAWVGKYTGPDAGTVSVEIDQEGAVRGQGVSTLTGIGFALAGKVQNNGQIELVQSAAGVTSTGATFTGILARDGQGRGTRFRRLAA
jgi:hypothetical protein